MTLREPVHPDQCWVCGTNPIAADGSIRYCISHHRDNADRALTALPVLWTKLRDPNPQPGEQYDGETAHEAAHSRALGLLQAVNAEAAYRNMDLTTDRVEADRAAAAQIEESNTLLHDTRNPHANSDTVRDNLQAARAAYRAAMDDAKDCALKLIRDGMTEVEAARRCGIDRMTVRAARGLR